jgi:exonuclease III
MAKKKSPKHKKEKGLKKQKKVKTASPRHSRESLVVEVITNIVKTIAQAYMDGYAQAQKELEERADFLDALEKRAEEERMHRIFGGGK